MNPKLKTILQSNPLYKFLILPFLHLFGKEQGGQDNNNLNQTGG